MHKRIKKKEEEPGNGLNLLFIISIVKTRWIGGKHRKKND